DAAQGALDHLGVEDLPLDGLEDREVRQVHREDQAARADGAPAQVMVAAEVGVGATTPRRAAVHDETPAAYAALGQPRQKVPGLDPVSWTAPELPVRGPEV